MMEDLSPIGLGTVKWGRNTGIKYAPFDLPGDAALHRLLDVAAECGLNFLDTAPAYGTSESRVGAIVSQRAEPWFLFTKAGEEFDGESSFYDFSHAAIVKSVERSLRRLRVERIDAVALHCSRQDGELLADGEAFRALDELQAAGKIGLRGVSFNSLEAGRIALQRTDFVMANYHPEDHSHLPVIQEAAKLGKGVLIKKALNSGRQTNVREAFHALAALPGRPKPVIGTLNTAHLRENVAALPTEL